MGRASEPEIVRFEDGLAVRADLLDPALFRLVLDAAPFGRDSLPLILADPPYGNVLKEQWDQRIETEEQFVDWMIQWTKALSALLIPGGALYVWGGVGVPKYRPFFRYLAEVEHRTELSLANLITWKKRRAYGVQHNYLFVREECAYLVKGDPKKPARFHIPLLDQKRGYAGYNALYPAKSEFLRRTNVWTDVTEILKGKLHPAQKAQRLMEIPIEVHTEPGDWVLDPFAGAGTTALACRSLGRKFVVVEKDEVAFRQMVERLGVAS